MEVPFDFKHKAIGVDFVGRDMEVNTLTNLLRHKQNVALYGPEGVGKKSLVNKVFTTLQKESYNTTVCHLNLLNVRTEKEFYALFNEKITLCGLNTVEAALKMTESSSAEPGPHLFDAAEMLATMNDGNFIIYIEEFQNVHHFGDPDTFLKGMEKVLESRQNVTYLISGSKLNGMKFIFEEKKYFYNQVEILPLLPINEKLVTDYVVRTFLRVGRVIDKEFVKTFYNISGGYPYHLWLLCSFSFNMTKGYVTNEIRDDAIESLISLREGQFKSQIDSLSNFQLNLVRAIFDGVTRFSNKGIIEKYNLSSSANVHRLKEALKKKEIIYFDENEDPQFVDPIFRYWLSKYYFV